MNDPGEEQKHKAVCKGLVPEMGGRQDSITASVEREDCFPQNGAFSDVGC